MATRAEVRAALRRQVERIVAATAINATANLIEATPVDTGWARSNWIPTVGAPHDGVVGSPASAADVAQMASQAAALGYQLEHGAVFVSNHVPYIRRLNDGSSAQAPAGFVQLALAQAVEDSKQGGAP